jgi:succinate-semialdehyde dehydrogenase/glutarate-semialdehyde dehydrogenase
LLRVRAVLLRKADMQLKDAQLFRQQAFIDGAWVDADNGQTIKVNNPATGEILGTVPKMGAAETRRAIEAADKALPAWRALTAKERAASCVAGSN